MKKRNYFLVLVLICLMCVVSAMAACVNGGEDTPSGEITPSGNNSPSESVTPSGDNTSSGNAVEDTGSTQDPNPQPGSGDGILVAYFSYSGTTESLAKEIAKQLGVEAVEIIPSQPYTSEDTNYNNTESRNRQELANDLRPAIASSTYDAIDMSKYKTVIIGYPIWNGYEPMIIRTFIEHYDSLQGKDVFTFSTSASSSGSSAHSGIKNRYANANIKENLHLTSSTIANMQTRVESWLLQNKLVEENTVESNLLYLKIGQTTLSATLVDNSSTRALIDLLKVAPIIIDMSDYANFEKVGEIGTTLPRNDEQITTQAGDLILYLGSRFVIYYDTNSWNFTRLGKINDITQDELKAILGSQNVTVELSLSM